MRSEETTSLVDAAPGSNMKMPMATDGVLSSMWLRNAVTGVKESSSSKRKNYV